MSDAKILTKMKFYMVVIVAAVAPRASAIKVLRTRGPSHAVCHTQFSNVDWRIRHWRQIRARNGPMRRSERSVTPGWKTLRIHAFRRYPRGSSQSLPLRAPCSSWSVRPRRSGSVMSFPYLRVEFFENVFPPNFPVNFSRFFRAWNFAGKENFRGVGRFRFKNSNFGTFRCHTAPLSFHSTFFLCKYVIFGGVFWGIKWCVSPNACRDDRESRNFGKKCQILCRRFLKKFRYFRNILQQERSRGLVLAQSKKIVSHVIFFVIDPEQWL